MRAAGLPLIITVAEPLTMLSGGPTQTHMSPRVAAGRLPINTVATQGPLMGPPTWGTTPVTMGQACMSVILAAGGMANSGQLIDHDHGTFYGGGAAGGDFGAGTALGGKAYIGSVSHIEPGLLYVSLGAGLNVAGGG